MYAAQETCASTGFWAQLLQGAGAGGKLPGRHCAAVPDAVHHHGVPR